MVGNHVRPAFDQPRPRLQHQQPVALGHGNTRADAAGRQMAAACVLGHLGSLIGRTQIADDHFAHHAFDNAADQRRQGARQALFIVSRFDQDAEHSCAIAESSDWHQPSSSIQVLALFSKQR
nr:hypothetical protein [Mesorhizobium amorphae]